MFTGLRASDETRKMKWGDIRLGSDEYGEYITFTERTSKTRKGGVSTEARAFTPKAYANPEKPERCPVLLYKQYSDCRPDIMCSQDTPFYLAINNMLTNFDERKRWFKCAPLGKNSINSFMKVMANEAGLQGRKTNHSARKTMVTNLVHAGVPPTFIQQASGHKNIQSINNYSVASRQQQKEMQDILANPSEINSTLGLNAPKLAKSNEIRVDVNVEKENQSPESHTQISHSQSLTTNQSRNMLSGLFSGASVSGCTFNFKISMEIPK